jgi:hypothetical protein
MREGSYEPSFSVLPISVSRYTKTAFILSLSLVIFKKVTKREQ